MNPSLSQLQKDQLEAIEKWFKKDKSAKKLFEKQVHALQPFFSAKKQGFWKKSFALCLIWEQLLKKDNSKNAKKWKKAIKVHFPYWADLLEKFENVGLGEGNHQKYGDGLSAIEQLFNSASATTKTDLTLPFPKENTALLILDNSDYWLDWGEAFLKQFGFIFTDSMQIWLGMLQKVKNPEQLFFLEYDHLLEGVQASLFARQNFPEGLPSKFHFVGFLGENNPSSKITDLLFADGVLSVFNPEFPSEKFSPPGFLKRTEGRWKGGKVRLFNSNHAEAPKWQDQFIQQLAASEKKEVGSEGSYPLNQVFHRQFTPVQSKRLEALSARTIPDLKVKVERLIRLSNDFQQKAKGTIEAVDPDDYDLSWSKQLKQKLLNREVPTFSEAKIVSLAYSWYSNALLYSEPFFIDSDAEEFDWNSVCWVVQPSKSGVSVEVYSTLPHPIKGLQKEGLIFPFSFQNGRSLVKSEFVRKLRKKLLSGFDPEKMEFPISKEIIGLEKNLIKLTKGLPVLHKYSLRIFELLPREEGSIPSEKMDGIFQELEALEQKVKQLSKGANERKKLFEKTLEATSAFKNGLNDAGGMLQQQLEAHKAINNASLYFYIFGYFMASAERNLPTFNSTVTIDHHFWKVSALAKKLFEAALQPLTAEKKFPLNVDHSNEETGGITALPAKATIRFPGGTVVTGIPEVFWEYRLQGKLVHKEWLDLQKRIFENEQSAFPLEVALEQLSALIANAVTFSASLEEIKAIFKTIHRP